MRVVRIAAAAALVGGLVAPSMAQAEGERAYVLNGEGDNLWVYDAEDPSDRKILIHNDDEPDGLNINAEICTFTSDDVDWIPEGEQWFIAGEDKLRLRGPARRAARHHRRG